MWLALSPIIGGLSGVGQRLKVVAQHWLMPTDTSAAASAASHKEGLTGATNHSQATAMVLPFPIRGEAVLVKLAAHLKGVVEKQQLRRSPFLFAITHTPHARLLIDEMAYAEFDVARGEYRVQVLVTGDTRVTAETSDFDVMVDFIAQYMRERLVETSALEVAS
jgi:hypothetical protein